MEEFGSTIGLKNREKSKDKKREKGKLTVHLNHQAPSENIAKQYTNQPGLT